MIEPRETFRANPDWLIKWPDVVDSTIFQAAVNASLLEMQLRTTGADAGTAAAAQFRMDGAKQFLSLLMGLTDPTPKATPGPTQNLQHKL